MNKAAFYDSVRDSLFWGRLSQGQVNNMEAIFAALDEYKVLKHDPLIPGYIFGTVYGEVGADMAPVREGFEETDEAAREHVRRMYERGRISTDYANRDSRGNSFYGRGYVQLTHKRNYEKMGERLGLPLEHYPDFALYPSVAARILVDGSMGGVFTGVSLLDRLPDDPVGAREVINDHDRAEEFAGYGRKFADAIRDGLTQAVA